MTASVPVSNRKRRRFFLIVTGGLSLIVSILILELGCRLLGFGPVPSPAAYAIPEAELHSESWLREAQRKRWIHPPFRTQVLETGDPSTGTIHTSRNECGFREDTVTPIIKPPGTLRVLVLGDSHTDGACANAESFSNLLETRLTSDLQRSVDVINAGQSSFSPFQEWWLYEQVGRRFQPDLVVVVLYSGNDYWDLLNSQDRVHLARKGGELVPQTGTEELPPQAIPAAPPTTSRRIKNLLRDHLAIYHALAEIGPLRAAFGQPPRYTPFELKVRKLGDTVPPAYFQSMGQALFLSEDFGRIEEANAMWKYTIHLFQTSTHRDQTRLLFAVLPTIREASPNLDQEGLASVIASLELAPEQAAVDTQVRIQSLEAVTQSGEIAIDLLPPLQEAHRSDPERRLYHRFDHHLAPEGHRVVANALFEPIRTTLVDSVQSRNDQPAPSP